MINNDDPAGLAYVDFAAELLNLPLAEEHRPGVAANLAQLQAIAGPLMEFPLSEAEEPAPVFEP